MGFFFFWLLLYLNHKYCYLKTSGTVAPKCYWNNENSLEKRISSSEKCLHCMSDVHPNKEPKWRKTKRKKCETTASLKTFLHFYLIAQEKYILIRYFRKINFVISKAIIHICNQHGILSFRDLMENHATNNKIQPETFI